MVILNGLRRKWNNDTVPCSMFPHLLNLSFVEWFFNVIENHDSRATKKITGTNLKVVCRPFSLMNDFVVVPYDISCASPSDSEDDDSSYSGSGSESDNDDDYDIISLEEEEINHAETLPQ